MPAALATLVAPVALDAMRPIEQVTYSYSANYAAATEPDFFFPVFGMDICAVAIPPDSLYGAASCSLQKSADGVEWEWCNDKTGAKIVIPLTAPATGIGQSTAVDFTLLKGINYLKIIATTATTGRLRVDLRRIKG